MRQLEVVSIDVKDGEVQGVLTENGAYFSQGCYTGYWSLLKIYCYSRRVQL